MVRPFQRHAVHGGIPTIARVLFNKCRIGIHRKAAVARTRFPFPAGKGNL